MNQTQKPQKDLEIPIIGSSKKKKKRNNEHIVKFFKGKKKTENTINVGNEKVHKLQLI